MTSEYYDLDNPYSIENWNKLIQRLNERIEAPPVGCPQLEPLEEVEAPHIWKVDDVQTVRDKIIEGCPDNEFDADLKIWKTDIIDEIVEYAEVGFWCDCEPVEISLGQAARQFCGGSEPGEGGEACCDLPNPIPVSIRSQIEGMQVGPPGIYGRRWRVYHGTTEDPHERSISGPVHCDGTIVYDRDYFTGASPTGCVSFTFCSGCSEWTARTIAEWQARNQDLLEGPDFVASLTISGGWRPCEEGEVGWYVG